MTAGTDGAPQDAPVLGTDGSPPDARDFHTASTTMQASVMTTSVTAVAGSSTSVVNTNAISTATVLTIATASTARFAPVSWRTLTCPTVIIENTTNATTLPIEAIALRSKNTASSAADTAVTTRPTGT